MEDADNNITYKLSRTMERKKIALIVFALGLFSALVFLPIEDCRGLGYRGTPGPNFRCEFDQYYFVFDAVGEINRGRTRQRRIAHAWLLTHLGVVLLVTVLVGIDYRRLTGGGTSKE